MSQRVALIEVRAALVSTRIGGRESTVFAATAERPPGVKSAAPL